MDRIASVNRTTKETSISLKINLDGNGTSNIKTPVGFLNHMLTLFSFYSNIDLKVEATGGYAEIASTKYYISNESLTEEQLKNLFVLNDLSIKVWSLGRSFIGSLNCLTYISLNQILGFKFR